MGERVLFSGILMLLVLMWSILPSKKVHMVLKTIIVAIALTPIAVLLGIEVRTLPALSAFFCIFSLPDTGLCVRYMK